MLPLPSAGLALGANTDGPDLAAAIAAFAAAAATPADAPPPPWPPDATAYQSVAQAGDVARWNAAAGAVAALPPQPHVPTAIQAALKAAAVAGDPRVYAALPLHVQALLPPLPLVHAGVQLLHAAAAASLLLPLPGVPAGTLPPAGCGHGGTLAPGCASTQMAAAPLPRWALPPWPNNAWAQAAGEAAAAASEPANSGAVSCMVHEAGGEEPPRGGLGNGPQQ